MKKLFRIASSLAALALVAAAPPPVAPLKGAVKPLEFLAGCWTGEGYMMPRGKRVEVPARA